MSESPLSRPFSRSVHQALHDALELSEVNMRFIVEGGASGATFEEYAAFTGNLMRVIQEQLVIVAAHVDDLEAEVLRLKGEQ